MDQTPSPEMSLRDFDCFIKGNPTAVTKNFYSNEFDCPCKNVFCTATFIHFELSALLQVLRVKIKKPLIITSGYRCGAHNKALIEKGYQASPKSLHMQGMAADIIVQKLDPETVAKYAEIVGFKGIGVSGNFTHVDVREKPARWGYK